MHAVVRRPATWEKVVHASHPYVLPAVAGTALTVGAGIAIASQAAPPVVAPIALIVAGATGVLASLVYARRWPAAVLRRGTPARESRGGLAYDHSLASAPLYYRVSSPGTVQYPLSGNGPRRSAHPAGELPSHLRAGDQLWTQWSTSGVGELPVAFIGPTAQVPYFPPEAEPIDRLRSLSEAAADAPKLPTGPLLASLPISVGVEFAPTGSGEPTPLCRSPSPDLGPIMLEALSVYPPHLRSTITPVYPPPTLAASRDPSSLCVSCRVVPYEGTVWLPCPECAGPVCGECVLSSFGRDEDGWCRGCAQGRTPAGREAAS